jgi:kynureninase
MTPLKASLKLFDEAGMDRLRKKSLDLTGFAHRLIDDIPGDAFELITPRAPERRGCQLSLLAAGDGRSLFDKLQSEGVICDFREPNVIRVAPVPLYNTFEDVWDFCDILRRSVTT